MWGRIYSRCVVGDKCSNGVVARVRRLGQCELRVFFFLMNRGPPRSTLDRSSAASDVYKRQTGTCLHGLDLDPHGSKSPAKGVRPAPPKGQIRGPVSYTHLRAHETVLDLVCRLLLEQKIKKNNKTTISLSFTHSIHQTLNI